MKAEDIHIKSVDPMNIDEVEDLDEDVSELLRSKAGGMSRKTGSGYGHSLYTGASVVDLIQAPGCSCIFLRFAFQAQWSFAPRALSHGS